MTARGPRWRSRRRQSPPVDLTQLAFGVPDVARLLDVSENTVWNLIRKNKLNKVDIGDCARISREELDRFLRSKPETADGDEKKERPRRDAA